MVGIFRDHHLSQQIGSRDAFVDDLRGKRCVDLGFAAVADPLATNVPFNAEHIQRLVELFADVFADMLEGAAAWALGVVRFVINQCTWKLGRHSGALGLLTGC